MVSVILTTVLYIWGDQIGIFYGQYKNKLKIKMQKEDQRLKFNKKFDRILKQSSIRNRKMLTDLNHSVLGS